MVLVGKKNTKQLLLICATFTEGINPPKSVHIIKYNNRRST